MIEGNAQLIFQALINLIDNAIKYSRGDGRVEIRLENDAGGIRLVVADNGPGIPEAQYGAVLEPFIRLDSSRHTPGVGLGLSVVSAVAELHEARLQLEDNRPGLRVVLAFPTADQPKRPVM